MKNINSFSFGVLLSVSCSMTSVSQEVAGVPRDLFGISLGLIFEEDPISDQIRGLNVVRVTEVRSGAGYGYHIFFEPIEAYPLFPYVEEEIVERDEFIKSKEEPFETSFQVRAFPLIPEELEGIATIEELEAITPRELEVVLITWSDILGAGSVRGFASRSFRYDWAKATCSNVGWHVGIEPEIVDSSAGRSYQCTFSGDTRELRISSDNGRTVQLKYRDEIIQEKEARLENLISRIRRNELRE